MSFLGVAGLLAVIAADGGAPNLTPPAPDAPFSLLSPPRQASGLTAPSTGRYDLSRADDGSGDLIHDARRFRARIAPDGTVRFENRTVSGFTMLPPWLPMRTPRGVPTLEGAIMRALDRQNPPPEAAPSEPDESFLIIPNVSRFRPDPREACQYPRSCYFQAMTFFVNAGGQLDVTDELHRFTGKDPYRHEKARFLVATRDMRVHLAARTHAGHIRIALATLPAYLEAIATNDGLTCSERTAVLRALREEMDRSTAAGEEVARRIDRLLESRPALAEGRDRGAPAGAGAVGRCLGMPP